MTIETVPAGPDLETTVGLIRERWPDTVMARTDGAVFFSLDESDWPNFATIVWTDAFDMGSPSDLARPGVFRVNVGVGKDSFERLVGAMTDPDYAALDQLLPHPLYAKQQWVAILNPSEATFRDVILPLIAEAHDRLVAVRERQDGMRR